MATELEQFIEWVKSKEGCDYVWPHRSNNFSGKDLSFATYKNVYDCSGLVTSALYAVTNGRIDWRGGVSAQMLFDRCERLPDQTTVRPCLAFYGQGRNMISHVVVCLPDGRIIGANGGTSKTLTPDIAKQTGARVRYYPSHKYRKDFRGFCRIPL